MSEIITIDTTAGVVTEKRIEPLPLYADDFPMLREKIPEYSEMLPNPIMSNLIKSLKMTMKLHGGIGLSANQCGVFQRVFVIGSEDFQIACINPKVVQVSEEAEKEKEGCLSYPGLILKVKRPKSILAEYTNETGQIEQKWLDGLTARCYLHELDHMNGIRFTEHVGRVALAQGQRKQQKLMKNVLRNKK